MLGEHDLLGTYDDGGLIPAAQGSRPTIDLKKRLPELYVAIPVGTE
jgi:hypothetical protein